MIVRSYNRLPALCELLERLRRQDHPSYEIVVVEQSVIDEGRSGAVLNGLQECLAEHFDVAHSTFQLEQSGHVDRDDAHS